MTIAQKNNFSALIAAGKVINHYQPIVNLQTGQVLGVEVLGRLLQDGRIIPPGMFLPSLDVEALEALLLVSMAQGLPLLATCNDTHPDLFMSFNVSPAVMLRPGYHGNILTLLTQAGVEPTHITLEILESDEFLNAEAARSIIMEMHASGVRLALDDVGAGYSSLERMRKLGVIDKIKLDQSFVRELESDPGGLHFVGAMLSLARGLRNQLVVEGVETTTIMNALTVLGVEGAQGYAIARPMPGSSLTEWLGRWVAAPAERVPSSLLGAYAAHLVIVESCRALMNQPLKFTWSPLVRDPHACSIGRYFDAAHLHETPYGRAHQKFHAVFDGYMKNSEEWEFASSELWRLLHDAIVAEDGAPNSEERAAALLPTATSPPLHATSFQDPGLEGATRQDDWRVVPSLRCDSA